MSSSEDESVASATKNVDDSHDQEQAHSTAGGVAEEKEEPDNDTLRVMISTDNHLGYHETDPVRGNDSFAAFEEVLYLAKVYKVDMVLLGGDLFHHNKPSRRTLYKTLEIMKRYCFGSNPVKIQILSDQTIDFRSKQVNYENPNVSIDLPVFSIHGNHDDPTRDSGSTELLAALDILSITNFINYFGRQDQVNKVEVSPVLIQKGSKTRVALYGMGNMRDERLNRMWQSKKVRFLRPESSGGGGNGNDDASESSDLEEWFNIFVLHQNRDTGRGSKNCIHESMIPNWVDLTIFGHEHASEPHPSESVVGTFRITQPGSTVATSLTQGEATRKHAVILNVRGSQFRLEPIPLTNVRAFVMHDICLSDHAERLDNCAGQGKLDEAIGKLLEEELRLWIYNAREKNKQLLEDAEKAGNYAASENSPLRYTLSKRDQVLVRLRVDHHGYTTLNNQRFGARFVGQVANPTDILLFHRGRAKRTTGGAGGKRAKDISDLLHAPMTPIELESVSVEALVKENLGESEQKLQILTEKEMAVAIEEFVLKTEATAISDAAYKLIKKEQTRLMKLKPGTVGGGSVSDNEDNENSDANDKNNKASNNKGKNDDDDDDMMDDEPSAPKRKSSAATSKRKRSNSSNSYDDDDDDEYDDDISTIDKENQKKSSTKGRKTQSHSQSQKKTSRGSNNRASQKSSAATELLSSDDDHDQSRSTQRSTTSKKNSKGGGAGGRKNSGGIRSFISSQSQTNKSTASEGRSKKKQNYEDFDDEDSDEIQVFTTKRSSPRRRTAKAKVNYSVDQSDDDDDDFMMGDADDDDEPPKKKKTRKTAGTATSSLSARGRKQQPTQESFEMDEDWGSAATKSARH